MNGRKCGGCVFFSNGNCRMSGGNVGYFMQACDDYQPNGEEASADAEVKTKVCKSCGRELPLTAFGGHHRTADKLQASCRECMAKKQSEGAKERWTRLKAEDSKPVEKIVAEKKEQIAPELMEVLNKAKPTALNKPLEEFTPQELFDELKRRGFSGRLARTDVLE